jgi:DNA adenine methylase
MRIRPAFKIHGGKYYLSPWVIENFPTNYTEMVYLEPYSGAASVLLNKKPSVEETINDIDIGVVRIMKALRDEPDEFVRRLKKLKYHNDTFTKALGKAKAGIEDPLDYAVNEYTLRCMSRDGLKKAFAWSDRLRGGQPGDLNAWETALEVLPVIAKRIARVFILNKPAVDVIRAFNSNKTLVYCDPTYLPDTRVSKSAYEFEMTEDDHIELAKTLNNFLGKAMVSGYPSSLYNKLYKGWRTVKKKIDNKSSQQKKKPMKTEVIWMNW